MEKLFGLLPKVIFLSYLIKMIAVTPSLADVGIIAALSCIAALQIYIEKKSTIQQVAENCNKQIAELQVVINRQSEVINLQAVEFSKLKNDMAGIKIKNDFTGIGGLGLKRAI